MKTNLHILTIMTALGVILSCSSGIFAQTKNVPVTGGFETVSVEEKSVLEAADFAVAKQAQISEVGIELLSIKTAESQVVAGTNYRLCMQMTAFFDNEDSEEEDAEEVTGFAKVVVYRNLKNEFSLTNWTVVESCDKVKK